MYRQRIFLKFRLKTPWGLSITYGQPAGYALLYTMGNFMPVVFSHLKSNSCLFAVRLGVVRFCRCEESNDLGAKTKIDPSRSLTCY